MEYAGVIDTRRVQHYSQNSVFQCLGHVEDVFGFVEGETAWVGKLAVDDRFQHAYSEVDCKNAASWVLNAALT